MRRAKVKLKVDDGHFSEILRDFDERADLSLSLLAFRMDTSCVGINGLIDVTAQAKSGIRNAQTTSTRSA